MTWRVGIQLSLDDLASLTWSTPGVFSALKNDAFYTAAGGKQTKMAAGGIRVEKDISLTGK